MTSIYHPSHPHYLIHKAFVEGSFLNPEDPPIVQYKHEGSHTWQDVSSSPTFNLKDYRLKPRAQPATLSEDDVLALIHALVASKGLTQEVATAFVDDCAAAPAAIIINS